MLNFQDYFRHILSLVGHEVSLGIRNESKTLSGVIRNAMFDSFIFETSTGRRIVRFEEVSFIIPVR